MILGILDRVNEVLDDRADKAPADLAENEPAQILLLEAPPQQPEEKEAVAAVEGAADSRGRHPQICPFPRPRLELPG